MVDDLQTTIHAWFLYGGYNLIHRWGNGDTTPRTRNVGTNSASLNKAFILPVTIVFLE